jgi:anti-sigma regulatory factor (Ser/Thr protein kinase)
MELDEIFTLEIPCRIESLPRILDFIAEAMERFGMDEDGAFDVNVAVDEACTNVINYSCAINSSDENTSSGGGPNIEIENIESKNIEGEDTEVENIEVTASGRGGMFYVTVRSRGGYFDPTIPVAPDTISGIDERKVGGLGVYFMQQLMDELKYSYNEGAGTLSMGKRLPDAANCGTHNRWAQ